MRAATTLILVLLVAGCGGAHSSAREQLAHYVKQVNRVERRTVAPLRTLTKATSRMAKKSRPSKSGSSVPPLAQGRPGPLVAALGRLRASRATLAAIPAPRPATHLRGLLLQLMDTQIGLTRQTIRLMTFLPRFNVVTRPLGGDIARLQSVLAVNHAVGAAQVRALYQRKAAALRSFKARLEAMGAQIRALTPPASARPGFHAEMRALRGMAASAGGLAAALLAGNGAETPKLLAAFDRAAASPQSLGVQKAQIAAIRAYDKQVAQVNDLAGRAQREQLRVSKKL